MWGTTIYPGGTSAKVSEGSPKDGDGEDTVSIVEKNGFFSLGWRTVFVSVYVCGSV